ncbi:uncharacterized protein MELLADRAFT_61964 [Melampsora larici-populina 98AG31]|uniref:Uncharacterized protein n=1 Tax=Melampsora larici-populina (strain 98AG31 / pathotype 3-4-7) TaxID=747676 RepID=F4RHF7_MELLP|nr:uncharacterized protein MELLADRAFT_61964 [Melampsora larici-populina 98AG31]EGG08162.1 hypothetical protein MELLADRAFT_61964 [Melampsora larici-populina 98AG31]
MYIDIPAFIDGRQFTISCKFEILADGHLRPLPPSWTKQFHSTISIENQHGENVLHDIKGYPADLAFDAVSVDGIYVISGRLISLNNSCTPRLFYEPDYQLISRVSDDSSSVFTNQVSVQSVGLVKSVSTSSAQFQGAVCLVVTHDDYDYVVSAKMFMQPTQYMY